MARMRNGIVGFVSRRVGFFMFMGKVVSKLWMYLVNFVYVYVCLSGYFHGRSRVYGLG